MTTQSDKTIRVALLGYGLAGSVFHAPLVTATQGMKIAAIVTSNPERQQQAKKDFPNAVILNSADDVWQRASEFDLVVLATPNKTHAPFAIKAMELGLHVVIDKPMATSVEEAKSVVEVSKKTKRLVTIFQNRRWDNDFLTVKKIVDENKLGPITRFESRMDRFRPQPKAQAWRESADPNEAGGLLFDLGSHLIDQALVLFGQPKTVYAEMDIRRPFAQVDDDTFIAITFENGVRAHLSASVVARIPGQRIRISGLHGTYEKWGADPEEDALRAGMRPDDPKWGKEPKEKWGRIAITKDDQEIDQIVESVDGAWECYYTMVRDAITKGGPLPVNPQDVITAMQVIEAAKKSAKQKQVVELSGALATSCC
jgi:predicted dehydrogenase